MPTKYPKLTKEEYDHVYMKIYYYMNRDRLLARAKRPVKCEKCNKIMPYSSLCYHIKKCHTKEEKPMRNDLKKEDGKFVLTFD